MDKDLREFLEAVGRRDLELDLTEEEIRLLRGAMKRTASTARLAHSIAERPEKTELYRPLAEELDHMADSRTLEVLTSSGLTEILDEHGDVIFSHITPSDVPPEDLDFLRDCGIKNPTDELTITTTRLRMGYWPRTENSKRRFASAEILQVSRRVLKDSSRELKAIADSANNSASVTTETAMKPKKYFNGIGKILSGAVAGTGNVLIGVGAIPATGGAAAAGVIASAAISVGLVMQGIGDLRGE